MSRGLGAYQRRVVERLGESEATILEGLSLADLRPSLPGDRSNRRRVLRSLVARGLVAWEMLEDEPPRLKLTWLACAAALRRLAGPVALSDHVQGGGG